MLYFALFDAKGDLVHSHLSVLVNLANLIHHKSIVFWVPLGD